MISLKFWSLPDTLDQGPGSAPVNTQSERDCVCLKKETCKINQRQGFAELEHESNPDRFGKDGEVERLPERLKRSTMSNECVFNTTHVSETDAIIHRGFTKSG